jgi:tryptophanyl-tRNA synthetase
MEKKILVSGIKPTGAVHIGNYFGAIKQFVDLQKDYQSFVFLADYHALTTITDREALLKNSFEAICAYLAVGIDPKKTIDKYFTKEEQARYKIFVKYYMELVFKDFLKDDKKKLSKVAG